MGFQFSLFSFLPFYVVFPLFTLILWNLGFIIRVITTLPRDIRLLYKLGSWHIFIYYTLYKKYTILNYFYNNAKKYSNDIAFIGIDGNTFTFKEFEEASNKLAIFFKQEGFKQGDCVGLLMLNKPEYILIWYSLAKLKIITAFLNYNLDGEFLTNCMMSCNASAIIYDVELSGNVRKMNIKPKLYCYGDSIPLEGSINIKKSTENIEPKDIRPSSAMSDILCYIFTSGSTGLPKPVVIRHSKAFHLCQALYMAGIDKNDSFYSFMPLYHIGSGLVVTGYTFIAANKLIIRKKFSASNFTADCVKYKITSFNYVGEVCRYLLSLPPNKDDEKLHFKCILGNGLRACSWKQLMKRYNIDRIIEFYGSTEGNATAINLDNKIGACGYYPIWVRKFLFFCIVKCTEEGELILDANNHAILCGDNETGVMVGLINQKHILTKYDGYINKADNEKKLRRDLFKKGDLYFISGDVLKQDEYGYLYFYDRMGDTYRWKGENVSTTETENFLIDKLNNKDVVVYGVRIPGHEGKAGMASILYDQNTVINASILNDITSKLPSYQRPVFIRLVKSLKSTSTMKLIKYSLQKIGYNLVTHEDIVYVLLSNKNYQILTNEIYDQISDGTISF